MTFLDLSLPRLCLHTLRACDVSQKQASQDSEIQLLRDQLKTAKMHLKLEQEAKKKAERKAREAQRQNKKDERVIQTQQRRLDALDLDAGLPTGPAAWVSYSLFSSLLSS